MNEKFIHAFISKNQPESGRLNKMTSSETHIIGDDPVQYPDGAGTMDEDYNRG